MNKRNGKELIYKVFGHERVDQCPWLPFAGVHAGFLKGYAADEVLKDREKLVASLMEVIDKYKPDGMPIAFDLQIEAEILGCDLMWAKDAPPSVASHPLADTDDIPTATISRDQGRLPIVMDAAREMKQRVGDEIALYGLFCGPFTLASHLRGSNIFMDMMMNPDYVQNLMAYTTEIAIQMAELYMEEGIDVITPVDPLISQISPKHFEQFCSEPYRKLFEHIRRNNRHSAFFVCGNAIKNIEVMCQTEPDSISIDENIPMETAKEITDRYDVVIGGNIPLTTTMLYGSQQDNMKFVIDLMDTIDVHHNFILSPGCDMPYNVPVSNGMAVTQAAHDPETARKLVADYVKVDITEGIEVKLPDYENPERPIVELFTLDPVSCAACTYMLAVFNEARQEMGADAVSFGEYRYNKIEDIARMAKVGVKNLPSIYLNGELAYDSIIPSREELVERIQKML